MILAFDVGNTNIVIGGFDRDSIRYLGRIATNNDKTKDEYTVLVKNILELNGVSLSEVEGGIISSVVPYMVNILKAVTEKLTGTTPIVIGPGVKTGLNIAVGDPAELGADLVVGAVAAIARHPETPLIILDLGTATTISVIGRRSSFLGVIIFPGVKVSFDALTNRTAQLPAISYDKPRAVIGTTTVDSMQSGLIYGNAGMLDGLIDRIEEEIKEEALVMATGGLAGSICPHCRHAVEVDDDLLLKGLQIIYYKNRK